MKRHTPRRLLLLLLLSGIALPLLLAAMPLQAQEPAEQEPGWSEPLSLSQNFPSSYLPDIAADQAGNLYVVWDVLFHEREGRWSDGVAFAMWDGTAWSPAVDIFGLELNHLPAIAVDSRGRLHLIGVGNVGLGYSRAWAQQQPIDARAWSDPVDLSDGNPAYWNDIVIDSHDRLHVVFASGGWILYTRSTDGGDSWSEPLKVALTMGGGRVQITKDNAENLYVVWSTETYEEDGTVAPGENGFTYSLDEGTSWSEPEVQVFDPGTGYNPTLGEWLSIAVDSQQTIHLVMVASSSDGEIRHLYKQGLDSLWVEDTIPEIKAKGLRNGYGFRGIVVDSSDNLHLVLPTSQSAAAQAPAGLFHTVWTKESKWSSWTRATVAWGQGCGLGNLIVSGGSQINVVWFEYLNEAAFYGRNEIRYASLQTGARPVPLVPLPTIPTAVITMSPTRAVPTPQMTDVATPTDTPSPTTVTEMNPMPPKSAPVSALVVGIGTTMLALAATTGLVALRKKA